MKVKGKPSGGGSTGKCWEARSSLGFTGVNARCADTARHGGHHNPSGYTCKSWVHLDMGGGCGLEHTCAHTFTQPHTHGHTHCVEPWQMETELKLRVYKLLWLMQEG